MAGPADEIIVRLTADAAGLTAGLQSGADAVEEAAAQMAAAGQAATEGMTAGTAEASGAWDALAANVAASTDAAKASIAAMADSARAQLGLMDEAAQASAAAYAELIAAQNAQTVRMTAQDASAGSGAVGGLSGAAVAQDAQMQAAIAREEASLRLKSAMSGEIGTAEGAAAAEVQLDAAYEAGAISADEYAAAIARLNIAQEENAASSEGDSAAHTFRFHGLYGTISEGLNALMTPTGAAIASIGALGGVMAYGAEKTADLNDALVNTGSYAGVTAADVETLATQVAGSSMSVGTASDALRALALSGHITGADLMAAGQAAADMASLTGESMTKAVAAIEKLGQDPLKASVALTDQMHYLSAAEYEQIAKLEAEGNASGAATAAIDAIRDAEARRVAAMNQEEPKVLHWLQEEVRGWENLGHAMISAAPDGEMVKRNKLATELNALYHQDPGGFTRNAAGVVSFSNANHYFTDNIMGRWSAAHAEHLVREWNALNAKMTEEHDKIARAATVTTGENAAQALAPLIHGFDKAADRAEAAKKVTAELMAEVRAGLPLPEGVEQIGRAFSGPGFDYLVNKTAGEMPHAAHIPSVHLQAAKHAKDLYDSIWNAGPPVSDAGGAHKLAVEQAQQAAQVSSITLASDASHKEALLHMQDAHISAMASMGTMGASAAIAQEQSIADQIYQIKLAELEKEKALEATKPVEVARINSEIVRLGDAHAATMQSLSDKAAAQQIKDAQGVVSPVLSTFSQVTAGFVEGTLTRQQAELRMGDALVAHEINWGIQKLVNFITIDNAKTIAKAEGEAKRLALTVASEAESAAIHVAHAVAYITTEAAKAAAAAFTAVAGIYIVGPVLAIAASVAAGAEVLSLVGNVASAAGGWERVPFDNAPALLHKDEMVLPADLAEGVRNMTGGGGNQYHYHIHANDAAGFEGMLRRNPQALVRALGHAHRLGATA